MCLFNKMTEDTFNQQKFVSLFCATLMLITYWNMQERKEDKEEDDDE